MSTHLAAQVAMKFYSCPDHQLTMWASDDDDMLTVYQRDTRGAFVTSVLDSVPPILCSVSSEQAGTKKKHIQDGGLHRYTVVRLIIKETKTKT